LPDLTNQKEPRVKRKKAPYLLKKAQKLSWSASGTPRWLSKKISQKTEKVSAQDTLVTRQKTNLAPDTGRAKRGDEEMKILEVLGKLEKHEAECNLRYQRIEEKLSENKSALKAFDLKLWGLAVLILIAPFVGKLMG
jgi:hypothetical protein